MSPWRSLLRVFAQASEPDAAHFGVSRIAADDEALCRLFSNHASFISEPAAFPYRTSVLAFPALTALHQFSVLAEAT
eukprot:545027-Prymnesium_polylepis.1